MKAGRTIQFGRIGGYIRLVAPRHLKRAWVFGSYAKGPAHRARDIDILVEANPGLSLMEASGLKIALEENTGRRVDVVTRKYLHPLLKAEIENTKVLVYEKH
jgi:uncharacterized protein